MFTTQLISYPESIVPASRRSGMAELVAMVAAGLLAVIVALALAGSAGHSTNTVPQVRDMAPAWNQSHVAPAWAKAAPTGRVSIALAPSTHSSTARRPHPPVRT